MAVMRPLSPVPEVPLPTAGWKVLATEAGRYATGLQATVQLWNHAQQGIAQLPLAYPSQWADFIAEVTEKATCPAAAVATALRTLTVAIEGSLRQAEARASRVSEAPADGEAEHRTDLGNARRLVARHGRDLRYCKLWGSWLVWDGTRWRKDDSGEVERRAKDTINVMYAEAAQVPDAEDRKALAKHALRSEDEPRLTAMVKLAQSEPGIPVLPEHLDTDTWLLNCRNGTIDLRTGELRPHRREDLITKLVPVAFDVDADCQTWLRFLADIFAGDQDLIAFLRRAIGYSQTGDTGERALFICHGSGRNGKSTLLETIAELLGDYALRTSAETLMVKRDGAIPNDVAALRGARFVHASETEEGRRLAEGFVKDGTGRDTIAARFRRAEWFTFRPVCKVWLRTNHKPVIRGTDDAIWDRVRLIPFEVRIPEDKVDHDLPTKLRAELPGILTWAVTGCLSWHTNGLGMPAKVKTKTATEGYREEMDVLGEFLGDCCFLKPEAQTLSKALWEAYQQWCETTGEKALTRKAFNSRLIDRGLTPARIGHGGPRGWRGIGLLSKG